MAEPPTTWRRASYDGNVKTTKNRSKLLEFRRYIGWRNKYAADERIP